MTDQLPTFRETHARLESARATLKRIGERALVLEQADEAMRLIDAKYEAALAFERRAEDAWKAAGMAREWIERERFARRQRIYEAAREQEEAERAAVKEQ